MRILVLLTAFLLAVSANPIGHSQEGSQDASSTDSEDVISADDDTQLSTGDNAPNHDNEPDTSTHEAPYSMESTGDSGSQDADKGDSEHVDTENQEGGNGDEHTSGVTTASETPTTAENPTEASNDTISTPPDADPYDCRNATQKGHIYLECSFGCEGDEIRTALNNATCYLHPENVTAELRLNDTDDHTESNTHETGVCWEGECVQRLTDTPASSTQSSPSQSSSTKAAEDPTQETDGRFTTPPDADPYDCRNATQRGHIYLACTYGCGGDEVLTALNNETCYIYLPNVTAEMVMSGQYNLSELHTNKTGVCFQGECVEMSAETTTPATESSPAQNTSPETASETQSPVNGQPSVGTEKPNNLPESLPEPSQPRNTSAQAGGSSPQDTVTNNNLGQVEETSSTATNGPGTNAPDAVPEALPALT